VAEGRNADIPNFYLYNLSSFRSNHVAYVGKSSCDKRVGFRRTDWSPLEVTPVAYRLRDYPISKIGDGTLKGEGLLGSCPFCNTREV
jgi:hypothetical protein